MADTYTTNLNLTKPEPGAAEDTWGISLNADLDALDAIFSSSGTQINLNPNQVNFADNKKAVFGAGSDLQIYHDGSTSYILDDGTGDLQLRTNNRIVLAKSPFEYMADFNADGAVDLYYDNSKKLATTSSGIDVTGTITTDGLTVQTAQGDIKILDSASLIDMQRAGTNYIYASNSSGSLRLGSGGSLSRLNIANNGDISFYDDTGSTQGLFWDASAERLGIGTTSPSGTLHVKNSTGSSLVLDATITGSSLTSLAFQRSSTNKWRILQQSNDSHLLFYNDVNGINQLSLKADGNIGIGESSPDGKLHIKGGTATGDASHVLFENTQGSKVFAIGGGASGVTNNNLYIRNVTDNTTPMVITDAGNVGVGTNSPARNLHVHASNFTDLHLTNDTTGATASDGTSFTAIGSDIYLTNREAGNMVFQTSGTERARIDSGGRLGIGTTSPSLKLHSKDTGNYQLDLDSGGTRWRMGAGWSGYYQNSFLLADTANGIRMAIDTSGKVGIGTALPSDKLHVVGDVRFTGQLKMFDNQLIKMGDGEDFAIYHDTTVGNVIKSSTSDMDIVIQGNDGGSTITALTLDMSVGGQLKAAPLGVSTPTYAFSNDSNTGMTRPTGDTLQFVTAGQERVRITDAGSVGIGDSVPQDYLEINGSGKGLGGLTISNSSASHAALSFARSSTATARIKTSEPDALHTSALHFQTSDASGGSPNLLTAMYIDENQKVGIGTSSPTETLHVMSGVSNDTVAIISGSQSDRGLTISTYASDGRTDGGVDLDAYKSFKFTTDGTERASIDSSGNVAIGNTSAAAKLDIRQDSGAAIRCEDGSGAYFVVKQGGTVGIGTPSPDAPLTVHNSSDPEIRFGYSSTQDHKIAWDSSKVFIHADPENANGSSAIGFSVDGSEKARIDNNGRFGIGTSSPSNILHIQSASATGAILNLETTHSGGIPIYSMKGAHSAQLRYQDENGNNQSRIDFLDGGDFSFIDATSGTSHMKISSSGNIGIGTTNPAKQLHVYQPSGQTGIVLSRTNNISGINLQFSVDSSKTRLLSYGDALSFWTAATGSGTNASERMRIDSNGNVGIGTSSPNRKLTVSGTLGIGIDDYIVHNGDSNSFFGFNGVDSWKVRTGGGDRLVIGNDDSNFNTNLGIGTSSPGEKLTVSGNTLTYGSTGNVGAGASYFLGNSQNSRDIALTRVDSATLAIGYYSGGWQESARFDALGNLLVGTTSIAPYASTSSTAQGIALRGDLGFIGVSRPNNSSAYFNRAGTDGAIVNFRKDGTTVGNIGCPDGANGSQLVIAAGTGGTNTGVGLRFTSFTVHNIIPCYDDGSSADNHIDLGNSGARFDDIYATNGTIQTSDRNEKQDIQALTDAEQRVATACKGLIRRFRWQDAVEEKGDDAR